MSDDPAAGAAPAGSAAAVPSAPPLIKPTEHGSGAPSQAELRAEAAAYRIEARKEREAREEAERQREEAKAALDRRIKEEVDKVNTRLTKRGERLVNAALKAAAVAAGLEDLDLLPLIKRDGVKITDDDEVEGIDDAVEALKQSKPAWFKRNEPAQAAAPAVAEPPSRREPPPAVRTGSAHAPAPAANPTRIDVAAMSRVDYANWKRQRRSRLRVA